MPIGPQPRSEHDRRRDQHQVLDDELADRGEQRQLAVLEGQLRLYYEHAEGAAEVRDEDGGHQSGEASDDQGKTEKHLDRTQGGNEPAPVEPGHGAGNQIGDRGDAGDLEGAEPDEDRAEREAQQGQGVRPDGGDEAVLEIAQAGLENADREVLGGVAVSVMGLPCLRRVNLIDVPLRPAGVKGVAPLLGHSDVGTDPQGGWFVAA